MTVRSTQFCFAPAAAGAHTRTPVLDTGVVHLSAPPTPDGRLRRGLLFVDGRLRQRDGRLRRTLTGLDGRLRHLDGRLRRFLDVRDGRPRPALTS